MTYQILKTGASDDYELLDSGDEKKLERFGDIILIRPDPQALWRRSLSDSEWQKASGIFGLKNDRETGGRSGENDRGQWSFKGKIPEKWDMKHGELKFWIKPTSFKHVGIFPEQEPNWRWMAEHIEEQRKKLGDIKTDNNKKDIEVLNLFAYTGGATLACVKAGAKVVHVDGSKVAVTWAKENAELSGLKDKPIRWILDDARAFVKREIKRGRKYNGIIMDPPAFGHGPNNQTWKIENDLVPLIELCMQVLVDEPAFFLINGYSAGYSAIAYENNIERFKDRFGGKIEYGELVIEESESVKRKEKKSVRRLPCGIFARWSTD